MNNLWSLGVELDLFWIFFFLDNTFAEDLYLVRVVNWQKNPKMKVFPDMLVRCSSKKKKGKIVNRQSNNQL